MAKRKSWSKIVEEHGVRVRLYERPGSDNIYREVRKPDGSKDRKSLGISDRDKAKEKAKELCAAIADLRLNPSKRPDNLTLGQLRRIYLREKGDRLSKSRKNHVEKTLDMLERHLSPDFPVTAFGDATAEDYADARAGGTLKPDDRRATKNPGPGTIKNELDTFSTVCNWATGYKPNGRALLSSNPARGTYRPEYKRRHRKQPRISEDRYRKLLAVADEVDPEGRFRTLLVLAWHTGRRITAMTHLRASDVLLTKDAMRNALAEAGRGDEALKVWKAAIRWRAEHDKMGQETFAPIGPKVVNALTGYMRKSARVGDAWLFPMPTDPERPADKQVAGYWLRRGEKAAELPHIRRGGWHAFRRAWAQRHKDLSPLDVAAVGGWFDLKALHEAYQSSDAERMLEVVNDG
ncbi:MAG: tyrosine-type recombinase/integrase [Candidatus Longimicrobiales bacterium M2_2A_002]